MVRNTMPVVYPPRRSFYSTPPRKEEAADDQTRSSTGEQVDDFFSRTRYSFSRKRSPFAFSKTQSIGSANSEKSTRTVESLRAWPIVDMNLKEILKGDEESYKSIHESVKLSPPASPKYARNSHSRGSCSPKSVIDILSEASPALVIDVLSESTSAEVSDNHSASQDGSRTASKRLPRLPEDSSLNVSLSPTDVEFLLTSIRRVAGDDFETVVKDIKNKRDPNIRVASRRSQRPSASTEKAAVDATTDSVPVRSVASTDETRSVTLSATSKSDPLAPGMPASQDDEDSKSDPSLTSGHQSNTYGAAGSARASSVLARTDSLLRSAMSTSQAKLSANTAAAIPRKISFSVQDNVRIYSLSSSEIEHKACREDEEDDILEEYEGDSIVSEQLDVPDAFDMPDAVCLPKSSVDEATDLFFQLYAEGLQTAKDVQMKCQEQGWGSFMGCGGGSGGDIESEPGVTAFDDKFLNFVPVIRTTESREGLQIAGPYAGWFEPFDDSCLDLDMDVFKHFVEERRNDGMVNVASLSFGSRDTSSTSTARTLKAARMASFGSVGLGAGRSMGRGRSHIHLLEEPDDEEEFQIKERKIESDL